MLLYLRSALSRKRAGQLLFVAGAAALAAWSYDSIALHARSEDAALAFGAGLLASALMVRLLGARRQPAASAPKQRKSFALKRTPLPPADVRTPGVSLSLRTPSFKLKSGAADSAVRTLESALFANEVQDETLAQHLWFFCGDEGQRTALLATLVEQCRARGQRVVVADRNGALLRLLWNEEADVLFNPWDERSASWSPLTEPAHELDASQVALSLLAAAGSSAPSRILRKACELTAQLVDALRRKNQASMERLLFFVVHASAREIESFLEQAGMTVLVEDEDFPAVRQLLEQALHGFSLLREASQGATPSLSEWLRRPGGGVWFATYHSPEHAALARVALDAAARTSLFGTATSAPMNWLVTDDTAALGAVPVIDSSLAKLKKRGTCVVTGFDSWHRAVQAHGADVLPAYVRHVELKLFAAPASDDEALDIALALLPAQKSPGSLPGQLSGEPDIRTLKALPRTQAAARRLVELPPAHWLLWTGSEAQPVTVGVPDDLPEERAAALVARDLHAASPLGKLRARRADDTPAPSLSALDAAGPQDDVEGQPEGLARATAPRVHKSAVFGKWVAPVPDELVKQLAEPGEPAQPEVASVPSVIEPPQEAVPVVGASAAQPAAVEHVLPDEAAPAAEVALQLPSTLLTSSAQAPAPRQGSKEPAARTVGSAAGGKAGNKSSSAVKAGKPRSGAQRRSGFGKADLSGLLK